MAMHVWLCLNGYAWILSVVWMVMCECLYSACFSMHEQAQLVVRVWLCMNGYAWMVMCEWLCMNGYMCEWQFVNGYALYRTDLTQIIHERLFWCQKYIVWPTVLHWIPIRILRVLDKDLFLICFFLQNSRVFLVWVPSPNPSRKYGCWKGIISAEKLTFRPEKVGILAWKVCFWREKSALQLKK
jgi:hypothetical protein